MESTTLLGTDPNTLGAVPERTNSRVGRQRPLDDHDRLRHPGTSRRGGRHVTSACDGPRPSPRIGAQNGERRPWAASERILSLLLQWDTAGLRFEDPQAEALDSVYCYLPEQDCLSPEPGWDRARIVRGYGFGPTYEDPDSAVFVIDFEGLGWAWSEGLEVDEGTDSETVWFKRIAGAWRIVGVESQMPPHLSVFAASRRYGRTARDSAVLGRWRN